ncbi:MAG TPA: hypothetical protein VH497_03295 [Vicinamibacterales bacterium]
MATQVVRSNSGSTSRGSKERGLVLAAAAGIVSVIAVYAVMSSRNTGDSSRTLLPYQALSRDLPEPDQQVFRSIRQGLLGAEADRARTGAWPEPAALARRGIAPFASAAHQLQDADYEWSRLQQGAIVNYFGLPRDPAQPAWLLEIQEPEPGMPPDPAPLDEEHHRLPNGTMLHTYVWMHRFGGQVPAGFIRQPQSSGWTEVFSTPPDPAFYNRR